MIHTPKILQPTVRFLVENRLVLTLGLSGVIGVILHALAPFNQQNAILQLIAIERPFVWRCFFYSYNFFLFSTPFLALTVVFTLLYVHCYAPETARDTGALPMLTAPIYRDELELVIGELHQQTKPEPSPSPEWLILPELGLYTGVAAIGAIGSGKTQAFILPAMEQLFAYKADDRERRLSGVVLEVKGDLCRQLRTMLQKFGRSEDYVEISLDGEICYNPLNNDLDPYAQAFNIASIITAIWGKGKEPFWQQSYTDLVRYVIMLHRLRDGYVTLLDIFRTVISENRLEKMLIDVGRRQQGVRYLGISTTAYSKLHAVLEEFPFEWNATVSEYLTPWTPELESYLTRRTGLQCNIYGPQPCSADERSLFESIHYWYWEHWKFFRHETKSSIIQGVVVFLSLFETDPEVRRVFCPPKEMYSDPARRNCVLPPFEELIETGKIVGLNFPVAMNPALAKIIGTMMKVDYQRAVQLRIPKMDVHPEQHFRPTVFICDEYQNFATVGGDNPTGDERFLSISRQPRCIPIVATQSISSLKDALPNEGVKTLLQAFRTKIFLSTADPDTARFASEICGKTEKTRISYTVSESSNNANVGLLSGRTSSSKGSVSASK